MSKRFQISTAALPLVHGSEVLAILIVKLRQEKQKLIWNARKPCCGATIKQMFKSISLQAT
jgi:hypothetical protein